MKLNTIQEILDRTDSRCLVCRKKFPNSTASLKKKSLTVEDMSMHVDMTFSLVNENIRFKLKDDKPLTWNFGFSCSNNRHQHNIGFTVSFNPRRLIITQVDLLNETIKFRKARRTYDITMDFVENKMSFQDPGSHKTFNRPSVMKFVDRDDIMNKIEGLVSLI